ncbi:MAG: hypothetical protein Q7T33_10310 [Dehalococcoidia bacterium]|nr:hypothetical protein [Dehalococcoidia bacterium]
MSQTGPKTPAGKARSSRNAVKHGFLSVAPVIPDLESEADWWSYRSDILESLEPVGQLEETLAGRIAEYLWRLRRVPVFEARKVAVALELFPEGLAATARYVEKVLGKPATETLTPEKVNTQVGVRLLPDRDTVALITRYEAHLHRLYIQTLHELEAIQTRRQGGHSPLARLDISGPPAP